MSRGLGAAGLVDADDLEGGVGAAGHPAADEVAACALVGGDGSDRRVSRGGSEGRGGVRRTRGGSETAPNTRRGARRARGRRARWWPARRRRDAPIPVGRSRDRYYYRARAAASVSRCLRGSIGWRGSGDAPMRPKPLMATFTLASVTVLTAAA